MPLFHNAPSGQKTKRSGLDLFFPTDQFDPSSRYVSDVTVSPYQFSTELNDGAADGTYGDMGITSDTLCAYGSARSAEYYRDLELELTKLGVVFPQRYSAKELITNPTHFPDHPIVIKKVSSNRGEDKILVHSYDELLNYLVWANYRHTVIGYLDPADPEFLEFVETEKNNLIQAMTEWDGETIGQHMWLDLSFKSKQKIGGLTPQKAYATYMVREYLRFEKYIEPVIPNTNTSLRLVIDALGNVHYSQLITAEFAEDAVQGEWRELDIGELITEQAELRLHDPRSPLFIPKRKIVSNRAQGGHPILLQSAYANPSLISPASEAQDSILEYLDIDPMTRELPVQLLELAKKVAYRLRFFYPVQGIDFMYSKDGNWYFLESNSAPDLNPIAMGEPADTSGEKILFNLINRLIHSFES